LANARKQFTTEANTHGIIEELLDSPFSETRKAGVLVSVSANVKKYTEAHMPLLLDCRYS
jgi:hypothetical protein